MHPELPYIAFLAAFLVLVPLPWHWRAGNVATVSIVAWLFVVNVIYGVDAIIWHGNVAIVVPVWCDITTKIMIGANIALPAACMCVCIHLEQVASVRRVRTMVSDKRRRQIFEAVICFLVPMLWMGLHYTVQGHRFDIIEDYGCRPNTYVSIPSIFLIWVPPLIFSAVTFVYAAVAFMHFFRRRITFAKHLENSRAGLTTSRYLRLMAMSIVEMIISAAATSTTLWFTTLTLRPWTNWADVHWNFSRVDVYFTAFTPRFVLVYYYIAWLILPISSLIFFLFFAFGQDALQEYGALVTWMCRRVLKRGHRDIEKSGSFAPLPSARSVEGVVLSPLSPLPSYESIISQSQPPTPVKGKTDEKAFHEDDGMAAFPSDSAAARLSCSDDICSYYSSLRPHILEYPSTDYHTAHIPRRTADIV
ncbi:Pheromone B beta 1 receptor [Grifola frondosa]|uniref:Pheromone B beta 1 receptor n=1 Tax=Grifola frondosa TaxID=5627 RepID=A0A1C7MDE8_GRIFR|nr:Pheromone B beta 1 receptor [Grifola frondosa]